MGHRYISNINPIMDYFMISTMMGVDIGDKRLIEEIIDSVGLIISDFIEDPDDIKYLDFEIRKYNNNIKFISKNLITALWFSGIFPYECDDVYQNNSLIYNNSSYSFNYKKNKLICKRVKKR